MDEWEIIRRYSSELPIDVVSIIRELGISYREKELASHQSGYFKNTGSGYEIDVNAKDGKQRKRFTAAHELGHYVLHRDLLKAGQHMDRLYNAEARSTPSEPFTSVHEVQANRFAGNLLLPAANVRDLFQKGLDPAQLAQAFGVSIPAINIRLANLGLSSR